MGDPDRDQWEQSIDRLADRIAHRGWTAPAILLLEVAKPLSFIASQGLLLCQPLSSFLHLDRQVGVYAGLLSDRSNVERLVDRLEQDRSHKEIG